MLSGNGIEYKISCALPEIIILAIYILLLTGANPSPLLNDGPPTF